MADAERPRSWVTNIQKSYNRSFNCKFLNTLAPTPQNGQTL